MTWPPAASMRAAAAITSITMNGGTSLRREAPSRFLARSLSVASSIDTCYLSPGAVSGCPRLAAFHGLLGHISYFRRRQSINNAKKCHVARSRIRRKILQTDGRHYGGRARAGADVGAHRGEGKGPAGAPGYRDRAVAARLHEADPARRRPGEAEHPGRDHQRQGV